MEGPAPEAARTRALTEEEAAARLGKTGGTPYRCEGTAAEIGEGLSLAASVLNGLRRLFPVLAMGFLRRSISEALTRATTGCWVTDLKVVGDLAGTADDAEAKTCV